MALEIQPINIGYYDPYDVYAKLGSDLKSKVSLTNLHWKKSEKESLRSIPQLQANFVEETPRYFDNNAAGPALKIAELSNVQALERTIRLLNTPCVRLMLIESDDIEAYKSKIRPLIREWIKSAVDGSDGPLDWYLIFYHQNDNDKSRTRVFEKLKVDFNPPDRDIDRCIKLKEKYTNQLEENESWSLLNNKLKSSILHSFTSRLQQLSSSISVLDSSNEPKSSTTFLRLALTEGLSRQFLQLRLFEDALLEYDYLSQYVKTLENNNELFPKETFDFAKEPITNVLKFTSIPSLFDTQDQSVTLFRLRSYVFSKQFLILNALSQSAPSLSIASIHVSECLRRLHLFIIGTLKSFTENGNTEPAVSEWAYQLIDEVLKLELCTKINAFSSDQSDENFNQVSERFGELLLVQRSQFVKLGTLRGLHIGEQLNEVSLDDEGDGKTTEFKLQYQEFENLFETQETFEEHYISLTGEAIRHFSIASRPRAVDALSIDIALVDYQNKNYERAVEVLSTCPEFYHSQGWDLISNSLLEIYADCLENLSEDAEFFNKPSSEDDEQQKSPSKKTLLAKLYLDITSSYKLNSDRQLHEPKHVKTSFEKMVKVIPDENLVYPAENLFDITPISSLESGADDTLSMTVNIKSPFETELNLKNSRILLKNSNDEVFKFEAPSITLKKGKSSIKFVSKDIILGEFKFFKLISEFNHYTLVYEFDQENTDNFLIYTFPKNLLLKIENSTNIDLTKKSISLFISTGELDVKSSEIRLWSKTEGFEPTSDIKVRNLTDGSLVPLEDNSADDLSLLTKNLDKMTTFEIVVPYANTSARNSNDLELKAKISYVTDEGERSQTVSKSLNTSFSIAVSVQDIFKTSGLFAKFSIGTADIDFPIRILSTKLQGNEKYKVSTALQAAPLIAFGEQPGNYFFKIEENEDVASKANDFLTLDITYRDLKEELKHIIRKNLHDELEDIGLFKYSPLMETILEGLKFDYTHYITDTEIKVLEFRTFDKIVSDAIDPEDRLKVIQLFEKFTEVQPINSLDAYNFVDRHLYIDVQIPSVHVIHTVELDLDSKTHYVVGDAIAANLKLKSLVHGTPETDSQNTKKRVQFQSNSSTTFSLEVLSNQDSWLVNGKTKFKFDIEKSTQNQTIKDSNIGKSAQNQTIENPDIELSLIPLKVGKLALPKIKITHDGVETKDEYLMEVDYQNENETIYVVSEMINIK